MSIRISHGESGYLFFIKCIALYTRETKTHKIFVLHQLPFENNGLDIRQLTTIIYNLLYYFIFENIFNIGLWWPICIRIIIIKIKRFWYSLMVPSHLLQTLINIQYLHHINGYTWMSNEHIIIQMSCKWLFFGFVHIIL